jgi:hypothetical protein
LTAKFQADSLDAHIHVLSAVPTVSEPNQQLHMMNLSQTMRRVLAAGLALCLGIALHAQVTTSGITGQVRGADGKPVAGAVVTAVHTPTNATFNAVTGSEGRYYFRSLPVGGPYTVSATADGFSRDTVQDLTTQLGGDVDVNFTLRSEVTKLEKFIVAADRGGLDSSAAGASRYMTSDQLIAKPTTQRSLADMISASNFVTLRAMSGDREEAQISAVGQNARYNSIMIDGARINDQFGLNFTGLASFFNPLSLDTIEQMTVSISPYDVRQSGFTGAAINAVTKSGTNQVHGSAYYMWAGDELLGIQMQGEDVQTRANTGQKVVPKTERTTKGFTLGGPLWKDHLFFFLSYEKFQRISPPSNPGFVPLQSELDLIKSRFAAINTAVGRTIDFGSPGGSASNTTQDEKKLAKVDWQITKDHRLTVRYSTTEGTVPQYGSFTATTGARGVNSSPTGPGFAFDSYFYSQGRKEKTFASQLVSQWTPNFKTELKFSTVDQDQLSPTNSTLPQIEILNVNGISQTGTPTTGFVFLGTEFSRQGNQIFVDTKSYSATAEYIWKNVVFTGGFDREQSDFYNLFRQGSYGEFDFNGTTGWTAGSISAFTRNLIDPALRNPADLSNFAVSGVFGQGRWDVSRKLSLLGGVRLDRTDSSSRPAFNQRLYTVSGFNNTGTVDGVVTPSPRVGFNYTPSEDRTVQLRGGVGRFLGRSPWVFFSNSYNKLGVGDFSTFTAPASLESFLKTDFDPNHPIGTGTDNPSLRREVDWSDNKIKLPAIWRGNLAADFKLPVFDTTMTIEDVETKTDESFFIKNENLLPTTVGADGRQRYAGSTNTAANTKYSDFTNLYHIMNVSGGGSRYISLSFDRPMKNHWSYNFSYTHGYATDVQVFGSTTAGSQWGRNSVFNQNVPVVGKSDFEIRNRLQLTYTREFNFLKYKNTNTLVSLYYEGRTGLPYSWVYTNDMNGDSVSQNDLIAIPKDVNDPRFNFSGMSQTAIDSYFAFLNSENLMKYAGGYAPRNAFNSPWVNRLDLHVSQYLPVFRQAKLELFMDFTNFGSFVSKRLFNYLQRTTLVSDDSWWRRQIGTATYDASGKIQLLSSNALSPSTLQYDNTASRWRCQIGARLKF